MHLTTEGILKCHAAKIPSSVVVAVKPVTVMNVYDWYFNVDERHFKKEFDTITSNNFYLDVNELLFAKYYETSVVFFKKDSTPATIVLHKNNMNEAEVVRRYEPVNKKYFDQYLREQQL